MHLAKLTKRIDPSYAFRREREKGILKNVTKLAWSGAFVKFQARAEDKQETLTEVKNV
jgi:hypothetical protein